MKELLKKVRNKLKEEFPEINHSVMEGVMFLLYGTEKDKVLLEKQCDKVFSQEEEIPSAEERNDVLFELLLKTGKTICNNKALLQNIAEMIPQVRATVLANRREKASTAKTRAVDTEEDASLKCT